MKDLKNTFTNIAGIMIIAAGAVGTIVSAGVNLPTSIIVAATITGSLGASIIAYLTGKNPDLSQKTEKQLSEIKK